MESIEQTEGGGLSRLDKMKAAVYDVAREVVLNEPPADNAFTETAFVIAARAGRKIKERYGSKMQEPTVKTT